MDYKELLKKAREQLPKSVFEKERFEIPKIRGHIQGNKTILTNFLQVADTLRRPSEHLLKYILKELATPGDIKKNGSVIIGAKISASRINDKVRQYAIEFVLCSECAKPDTKIEKEDKFTFLKCHACGAKHPIKAKI
ncbi:MAG TPA: translation initiation factor IF-2 subunit beta [Candidatus Nanoarchaeia archaeon]|nr:translation initiation factor IF-2 subunit beta [Candidatus Nanoarchaeia archaeon]